MKAKRDGSIEFTKQEAANIICKCGHSMADHRFFEDKCSGVYWDFKKKKNVYNPKYDDELNGETSVFNDGCSKCKCMEMRPTLR